VSSLRSSKDFLDRLNAGNTSAKEEVYTRYFDRLHRAAERLIGKRLRRVYAPEDAAQSALASFFRGMAKGRYHFDQSGRLWGLLVTIMRHKLQEHGGAGPEQLPEPEEIIDGHPPPEKAVELADAIEAATAGLKPRHLEICRLFYQEELSLGEIAARVERSRWTVRRVLDEFGSRLCDCLDGDSAG
jgi:RNA polymerase sigma factor (sigma-70 family)